MVVVPAATSVTSPVAASTVATSTLLEVYTTAASVPLVSAFAGTASPRVALMVSLAKAKPASMSVLEPPCPISNTTLEICALYLLVTWRVYFVPAAWYSVGISNAKSAPLAFSCTSLLIVFVPARRDTLTASDALALVVIVIFVQLSGRVNAT